MSVVETTKFNMPLGNPADLFNFTPSPLRDVAVTEAAGAKRTKSGKVYLKKNNTVKNKTVKIKASKNLNKKQMKAVVDFTPSLQLGTTIPIHPGTMPKGSIKGPNGKFTSNPAYESWKERARKFNAGLEDQRIIQGHKETLADGSPNFPALQKVSIPGKFQRARGYELPTGTNITAVRKRKSMINRMHGEALKIDAMRNKNLSTRQKFPS